MVGLPCLGLKGGPEFKHNEAFSFQIATDTQAETDRYRNAIVGNGGSESACGWCKDRWGLSWRLKLYRGEIGPDAVITGADTDDVQVATLAFGVGNWYLVRGDKAQARTWFERSVNTSGGWPGFGFILSEMELQRMR